MPRVLRTRLLSRFAFGMMICSPSTLRRRVLLMPMYSTVPLNVVDGQAIADHERPVERDRQRREQIAEHVLGGERDRDAADAEAGEQRLDLDAEVVERQQQDERPDRDARQEADDAERAGRGAIVLHRDAACARAR